MINDFPLSLKPVLHYAVQNLSGTARRVFLSLLAASLGYGGQAWVIKEFHVGKNTITKGKIELATGLALDYSHNSGRKPVTEHLPDLLIDLKQILDLPSQTDPNFKTTRLFTRLTIKVIRQELLKHGYQNSQLPSNETLRKLVNSLGYKLAKVRKTKPLKKIPETDAIFANVKQVKAEYHGQPNVLEISLDTKDRVKVGPFDRGGKTRQKTQAADHDFGDEYFTPFGMLDLTHDRLNLAFTESKVTADFMVDALEEYWNKAVQGQSQLDTLVLYADNGPENSSRRTQYIKRLVKFSAKAKVKLVLAYYPPYHSKYNPVERAWGALEQHWNGSLLESKETILKFAQSMTWKGQYANVREVKGTYPIGIKLNKEEFSKYDAMIQRTAGIEKWAVEITPEESQAALNMT